MKSKVLPQIIVFLISSVITSQAQDTLFYTGFSAVPSGFSLNTSDVGSTTSGANFWVENNSYPGGNGTITCLGFPFSFTVPSTPAQPVTISGFPNGSYLHTVSNAAVTSGISNCCFAAADGICTNAENYFCKMSSDISTIGFDTVTVNFWWLCSGGNNSYGELYYSFDGGTSWIQHAPGTKYNNTGNWTLKTITDPAWSNHSMLRFGFRFVNNVATTASDPGFGVDEFLVTGKNSVILPVAAFTANDTAFCEETCLFFTDLSQNNPTSWQWYFEGAIPDTSSLQNPTQICYDDTGTFDVTLIVTNASGIDTLVYANYITVYANPPTPLISASSDTLCTVPFMAGYQWYYNNSVLIPGAVNYCYIAIFPGTYSVQITDSSGCSSFSDPYVITSIRDVNAPVTALFPNPVANKLTITAPYQMPMEQLMLKDLGGRVVLRLEHLPDPNAIQLDLSIIPIGLYNLFIYSKGNWSPSKVVISR
ncbi:MAG TPA: PKD domain-containing protein [Bacteroidia bacterium]|nr:PKD domain-containing protein [Bacteroidia bacterium]